VGHPTAEEQTVMALESGTSVLLQIDVATLPLPFLFRLLRLASTLLEVDRSTSGLDHDRVEGTSPLPIGLFLYTRAFNPRLPPALAARVNVVNFALGAEALEQRLMATVLNHMQPKAELAVRQLAAQVETDRLMALKLDKKLLGNLSSTKGAPWDDSTLMQTLLANLTSLRAITAVLHKSTTELKQTNDSHAPYQRIAQVRAISYAVPWSQLQPSGSPEAVRQLCTSTGGLGCRRGSASHPRRVGMLTPGMLHTGYWAALYVCSPSKGGFVRWKVPEGRLTVRQVHT
jgi:hypothetical protein